MTRSSSWRTNTFTPPHGRVSVAGGLLTDGVEARRLKQLQRSERFRATRGEEPGVGALAILSARRGADVMPDATARGDRHVKAALPCPHAHLDVFVTVQVAFVESAELLEERPANGQAGSGHRRDGQQIQFLETRKRWPEVERSPGPVEEDAAVVGLL
mgnify:CR=1 FL=1